MLPSISLGLLLLSVACADTREGGLLTASGDTAGSETGPTIGSHPTPADVDRPPAGVVTDGGPLVDGTDDTLHVWVVAADTGLAVAGAAVEVDGLSRQATNADGYVGFEDAAAPATVTVTASGYTAYTLAGFDAKLVQVALFPLPACYEGDSASMCHGMATVRVRVDDPLASEGEDVDYKCYTSSGGQLWSWEEPLVVTGDVTHGEMVIWCWAGVDRVLYFEPTRLGVVRHFKVEVEAEVHAVDLTISRELDRSLQVSIVVPEGVMVDGSPELDARIVLPEGDIDLSDSARYLSHTSFTLNLPSTFGDELYDAELVVEGLMVNDKGYRRTSVESEFLAELSDPEVFELMLGPLLAEPTLTSNPFQDGVLTWTSPPDTVGPDLIRGALTRWVPCPPVMICDRSTGELVERKNWGSNHNLWQAIAKPSVERLVVPPFDSVEGAISSYSVYRMRTLQGGFDIDQFKVWQVEFDQVEAWSMDGATDGDVSGP